MNIDILPKSLLLEMASTISEEECAEMAIPSYLHKNPVMRWMANRRVQILIEWLLAYQNPSANMLDFGCGTGILFRSASNVYNTIYAVDLVLAPAQLLIDHYDLQNVRLLTPQLIDSEIPDNSIDLLICGEVLEHIRDIPSTLKQLQHKLKPNGHLLVSIPTENIFYKIGRFLSGFENDYHVHNAADIHKIIVGSGFEPTQKKYIPFHGPLAIYWLRDYIFNPIGDSHLT